MTRWGLGAGDESTCSCGSVGLRLRGLRRCASWSCFDAAGATNGNVHTQPGAATNVNFGSQPDADTDGNFGSQPHANTDGNFGAQPHANTNGNFDTQPDADTNVTGIPDSQGEPRRPAPWVLHHQGQPGFLPCAYP